MPMKLAELGAALAAASDPTFIVDVAGIILFASDSVESLFGYPPGDLIGQSVDILLPSDQRSRHGAHRDSYHRAPRRRMMGEGRTLLGRRVDGVEVPVEVSLSPVTLSGMPCTVCSVRDATEHRRTKESLSRAAETAAVLGKEAATSREHLGLFIRHAPAAVAMFDRDMHYLAASDRWIRDYALEDGDVIGRSHYELFPNMPDHWRVAHRRGLAGEIVSQEEDSYTRPDGRVEWIRWELRPWRQADGSVGGIILFTETITGRMEARFALSSREQRFSAIFDVAPRPIALVDLPAGRHVEVNRAWQRTFGYGPEEARGRTSVELGIHPDDAVSMQLLRDVEERGETAIDDVTLYLRGGATRRFSLRATSANVGDARYAVVVLEPIDAAIAPGAAPAGAGPERS